MTDKDVGADLPRMTYAPAGLEYASADQNDLWCLRFADQDCGDQWFGGEGWTAEEARSHAIDAWNRYAPAWSVRLMRTVTLDEVRSSERIAPQPDTGEGLVRQVSRAIHEHLSRRDIMQYLGNDEDCEGLARAVLASLSAPTGERAQIVAWQPIETAPKGEWIIGKRDPAHTGRSPAFVGQVYDLRADALLDEWTGKWAVCTHWARLPDHLAPLTPSKDSDHE